MKKPTILIFNVDETVRKILVYKLFRHGYKVIEVPESSEPFDFFKKTDPCVLIVCSSRKESKDQLKTIKRIRRQDRRIPIIMLTRFSSEEKVIAALRAGVNDYFKAPFGRVQLLTNVGISECKSAWMQFENQHAL